MITCWVQVTPVHKINSAVAEMSGKRNKISQKLSSTSLAGSKDSSKEVELLKQNEVVYKSKIRAVSSFTLMVQAGSVLICS